MSFHYHSYISRLENTSEILTELKNDDLKLIYDHLNEKILQNNDILNKNK